MSSDDPTAKLPSEDFEEHLLELSAPLYALQKRLRQFEEQVAAIPKIEEQVFALDQKVDKRLHETRPIWEGVLAELRDFRLQTETSAQGMKHKIDTLVLEVFEMRVRQGDLETRLKILESGKHTNDKTPK